MDFRKVTPEHIKLYRNEVLKSASASTFDRKIFSLKKFYDWAAGEGYVEGNPVEEFLKLEAETVQEKLGKIEKQRKLEKPSYSSLQARIVAKFAGKPKLQKLAYNAFYTRPQWYKSYHNLPIATYFNYAILILLMSGLGFGIYNQFFKATVNTQAYPTALTRAGRYLSFQGRLTNKVGNPITTSTGLDFKLYNASTSGTLLWDSGSCAITPDTDGIFSTLLGSSCGSEISSSVFTENPAVWLGVTVGVDPEATPRVQIATVAYALNSETLQGFPASASATANTIPAINSLGYLVLGSASPKIQSTSGNFAIEGQAMTLTTPTGSNGSITIAPDGTGSTNMQFSGATPGNGRGMLYVTDANLNSKALIYGSVANDATGYNLLELASGTTPRTKFAIDSAGNATLSGTINGLGISGGAITSGTWTGSLIGTQYGGTGANNSTASQYSIPYYSATGVMGGVLGPGSDGYVLTTHSGTGAPTWTSAASVGTNYWQLNSNVLAPINVTNDLAIGGNATGSAKFQVLGATGNISTANNTIDWTLNNAVDALNIDANTLSIDAANNRVGIGTASPLFALDVNGVVNISSFLITPAIRGSTYTGVDRIVMSDANTKFQYYNGSILEAMRIDTNGNIGIGTTTPTAKLSILGSAGLPPLNIASSSGSTIMSIGANGTVGIGTNAPQNNMAMDVRSLASIDGSSAISAYGYNGNGGKALSGVGYATSGTGANYGIYGQSIGSRASGSNIGAYFSASGAPLNYGIRADMSSSSDYSIYTGIGAVRFGDNVSINGYATMSGSLAVGNVNATTGPGNIDASGKITGVSIYQGANQVCDTSGNCSGVGNLWRLNGMVLSPVQAAYDLAIGETASSTAKFLVNAATGNLTTAGSATVSGNITVGGTINIPTPTADVIYDVVYDQLGEKVLSTMSHAGTAHIGIAGYAPQPGYGLAASSIYASTLVGGTVQAAGGGGLQTNKISAYSGSNISFANTGFTTFTGNVGIATSSPSYKLDVAGDINTTGALRASGNAGTSGQILSSTGTGLSWIDSSTVGTNYWQLNNTNELSPANLSFDVLLGGTSTASANAFITSTGSAYFAGNVGIGTRSPSYKLEIASTPNAILSKGLVALFDNNSGLGASDTLATIRAYYQTPDPASNILAVGVAGASNWERFVVKGSGNVGIGTTTPTAKLDIAGDASTSGALVFRGTSPATIDVLNGDRLDFQTSPGGDAGLTSKMTILNNGNVGIGTTNPSEVLDINGDIKLSNYRTRTMTRSLPTTVNDEVDIGSFNFTNGGGSLIVSITVPSTGFSVAKEYLLPIKYSQTSNTWTTALPTSSTGNYSSQDFDLDVNVNGSTAYLRLRRTSGSTAGTAYIVIKQEGVNTDSFTASTATSSVTAPTTYFGSTALTQVNGNVGISTTNPGQKLDVSGNVQFSGALMPGSSAGTTGQFLVSQGAGAAPTWTSTVPATSIPFSGITSGTNTTAAMVVGAGASLTYAGGTQTSGVINANQLLGGTWAIPGAIGSTTPNTGAFTTLTSNTLSTGYATMSGSLALGNTTAAVGPGHLNMSGNLTAGGTINGLTVSGGTITGGTWNGTAIGATYGGTGQTSYAVGDLLYANTTTTLSRLADIATGNVLISGGVNTAPSWGKVVLGTHTTGNYVSSVNGTANQISTNVTTGDVTLSIPSDFRAPGTVNAVNGIYTGATTGTQRIDASGNLINIANISASGYATVSGSLALGSSAASAGPGNLNMSGNLTVGGTTTLGGRTYTWPGTETAGFLTTNGSGTLGWTTTLPSGTTIGFDKITTGTNTSQTLTVGNGSSLTYTGTGTINASSLIGATWAAPGAIGSTTPNTGAFTTLSSNTLSTGYATMSGSLALGNTTAAVGPGHLNISGNLTAGGTINGLTVSGGTITGGTWNGNAVGTQYGGTGQNWSAVTTGNIPYFSGTGTMTTLAPAGTNDYVLTSQGAAAPQWKDVNTLVPAAVNYWKLGSGTVSPFSDTLDVLFGNSATASAKFAFTGVGSGTPNIMINNASVLNATTLGSGVTTSSLTTVGALASGSIANGFGTIATANTITGTTINGTTGINTGSGAGTQRIDANGNLVNILNISASGNATVSGILTLGQAFKPGGSAGTAGQILTSAGGYNAPTWTDATSVGVNHWQLGNNVLAPINVTNDLAIGGNATGSAKFQVLGATGNISTANNTIDWTLNNAVDALDIDANTLTIDALNNRVGIGTAPSYKLDVRNGVFNVGNASGSTSPTGSGLAMGDNSTNGYFWVQTFGSKPLSINPLGNNVGVGISIPTAKLDVAGDASTSGSLVFRTTPTIDMLNGTTLTFQSSPGGDSGLTSIGTLSPTGNLNVSGTLNGLTVSSGTISGGTWQATAIGTQYGGTGQNWSAVVRGSVPFFNNTGAMSTLAPSATSGYVLASQGSGADPTWVNPANFGTNHWQLASNVLAPINVTNDLAIGGNATSSAKFQIMGATGNIYTANNAVDWTLNNAVDALNIDANTLSVDALNNKVGIGMAAPSEKLEVAGNIIANNSASRVYITATSGNTIGPEFRIASSDTGGHEYRIGSSATGNSIGAGSFYFYDQTYGAMRFVINPNGLFGMGVNNPAAKLDVADSSLASINDNIVSATSSAMQTGNLFKIGEGGTQTFSGNAIFADIANGGGGAFTGNFVKFNNAGSTKLTINSAGNINTTGTITGTAIYQGANQVCDTSGNCTSGGVNHWQLGNNVLAPINVTNDLAIGGNATGSAKFQVLGATGNISTANNTIDWTLNNAADSLNFDANTLSIDALNNRVGIGTIGPDSPLDVLSTGGSQARLTYTDGAVYTTLNTDSSGNFTIDATGTKIVIADDLQINGNDILDSSAVTRVTLGSTTTLTNTTTTLSGTTTLTASGLTTMTTAANLAMSSTTGLTLGGNSTINGGSAASGTVRIDSTSNATKGNISFNGTTTFIDGLGNLKVGGYATASASLALGNTTAAVGPGHLNMSGDLTIAGAIKPGGNAGTLGFLLTSSAGGVNTWTNPATVGTNHWQLGNNVLAPINVTNDLAIGGNATGSAKFQVMGATGNISTANNTVDWTLNNAADSLNFDANTLSIDALNNRVGIGTASPQETLHVLTSAATRFEIETTGTTVNDVATQKLTSPNASFGWFVRGSDTKLYLWDYSHSTERMTIDTDGNVGIGTTSPQQALDVNGYIRGQRFVDTSSDGFFIDPAAATVSAIFAGDASMSGSLVFNAPSINTIDILNGARLDFQTSDGGDAGLAAKMTLLSNGNVGIGTISPESLLSLSSSGKLQIGASSDSVYSTLSTNDLIFHRNAASYINQASTSGSLRIGVGPISSTTAGMTIDSNNNVGIGTTAPNEKLEIDLGAGNTGGLRIGNNNGVGAAYSAYSDVGSIIWYEGVDGTDSKFKIRSSGSTWAAGTDRLGIDPSTGYVGVGTVSPQQALDVNGYIRGQRFVDTSSASFYIDPAAATVSASLAGDIVNSGAFSITTGGSNGNITLNAGSGNVVIGDGATSKLDAGTIDPPYTIDGKQYATYVTSMTGVKEETTGTATTSEFVQGEGYRTSLDFANAADGSDLWVFSNVTNLSQNTDKLVVLLSPAANTKAWYAFDPSGKLYIYTSQPTQVSYRLTAPRFDSEQWQNTRQDGVAGFTISGNNKWPALNNAELNPVSINDYEIATISGGTQKYNVVNSITGQIVQDVIELSQAIIANIKAGAIVTKELAAESFTSFQGTVDNMLVKSGLVAGNINTKMISPLADSTDVTIQVGSATESGKLAIQNAAGTEVASIDNSGNASFSGTLYADAINSKSLDDIKAVLTKVQTDQALLADAASWNVNTATTSSVIATANIADLYVTNQAAVNSLSVTNSLTLGTDMVFQSTINNQQSIINSIDTLTSPLKIQSLAMAPIEMMAGLVKIDTAGNVQIAGNLAVAGQIESAGLTLKDNQQSIINNQSSTPSASLLTLQNISGANVATIDASGSAMFNNVATQGLTIAGAAEATNSAVVNGVIKTNATAGSGVIPAGVSEIAIENASVTDYTLVYVTPTSSTDNYVLYVKSKGPGKFVVGFTNPISIDVNFNWWIVKVTQ